jgi:hypothetical protein
MIRGAIVFRYVSAVNESLPLMMVSHQLALQFAWSLILMGGMLVLPETPRFLIKRGRCGPEPL